MSRFEDKIFVSVPPEIKQAISDYAKAMHQKEGIIARDALREYLLRRGMIEPAAPIDMSAIVGERADGRAMW